MKSFIRLIMVLAVFGLVMGSSAPAQEGAGQANVESGAETIGTTVATPSKAPPLPPPGPSLRIVAADSGVLDDFATSVAILGDPINYISLQPGTPLRSSSKVLVIPNTEIKTEDVTAITQDLQVMAHIFHKIFTGPRLIEGIFEDYGEFFGRGSRATQAIYLQGYGTLFLMEVDFPFTPPAESKEKAKDTKEADSVWNQAKQEIFSPIIETTGRRPDPREKYDAEKVEEVKKELIKSLKHAANIRNLKSDEWVVLTVIGKGGSSRSSYGSSYPISSYGRSIVSNRTNRRVVSAGRDRYSSTRIVPGGVIFSLNTVLTIRAKKSDVDTFAKGDLDYDEFREKAQILTYQTYPSLGQTVGRRLRITGQRTEQAPYSEDVTSEPTKLF